ncbi:DUF2268 domain-containing putative Zn-dependent protease [Jannaschia donghaensis]|uniref:DUF2268 domain-containing protein n=1 Tax=Jannaschia donghaensis TaxID=420998 RepID=A0A0M6YGJ0_9RHOB|nr:DUF2268 domain-containing putative Zn-dependent protease [Jannaschia donghaensis]CTQ49472.1 hypothetical protein JDO7802_01486 [Jannaschia donghaensis]
MTDWAIASVSPSVRPFAARIEAAIAVVRFRVAAICDPQPIAFTLKADRIRAIPRFGFGGSCYETDAITLSFDTKSPNVEAHLDETLERTIAHEYHHALRWGGPGYGAKLGAALVSEGLAGHFVRQIYGSPPEPWESALAEEELAPWRAKAFDRFDARDHGHARWFFGADDHPPWLGYTLGYDMIGRYLAVHPDRTALDLAHEPYGEFKSALIG